MSSTTPYLRLPRPTLWLVKGNTFRMGGDAPDGPPFEVEVGSFYLSKGPVTNLEFEAFAPEHPRMPTAPGDRDPVVGVSFDEAAAYCAWYAAAAGKAFRLPTEVEWELACRGGTTTRFWWGEAREGADANVWDAATSGGHCHEIETAGANAFGLYDMLGNVWEWTSSRFLPYPVTEGDGRDALNDPGDRVIRGGSFRTTDIGCATRASKPRETKEDDLSFRIVRSL